MQFLRSISIKVVLLAAAFCCCASAGFAAQAAEKDAIVEGRVIDLGSKPIEGASVRLERAGKAMQETRTGANGQYILKTGNPGTYQLRVEKEGYSTQSIDVLLEAGKKDVDVVMKRLATGGIEFSDTPNFTVAGVTDWSNVGLHGSDANVKTS